MQHARNYLLTNFYQCGLPSHPSPGVAKGRPPSSKQYLGWNKWAEASANRRFSVVFSFLLPFEEPVASNRRVLEESLPLAPLVNSALMTAKCRSDIKKLRGCCD
jgi:hypothetical protein